LLYNQSSALTIAQKIIIGSPDLACGTLTPVTYVQVLYQNVNSGGGWIVFNNEQYMVSADQNYGSWSFAYSQDTGSTNSTRIITASSNMQTFTAVCTTTNVGSAVLSASIAPQLLTVMVMLGLIPSLHKVNKFEFIGRKLGKIDLHS
jgi:hypothetical protein